MGYIRLKDIRVSYDNKNNILEKYIKHIFRVVYLVFNVPKDAFKIILDTFNNKDDKDK